MRGTTAFGAFATRNLYLGPKGRTFWSAGVGFGRVRADALSRTRSAPKALNLSSQPKLTNFSHQQQVFHWIGKRVFHWICMRSFLVWLISLRSVLFLHFEAAEEPEATRSGYSAGRQIAKPNSEQNHFLPMSRSHSDLYGHV